MRLSFVKYVLIRNGHKKIAREGAWELNADRMEDFKIDQKFDGLKLYTKKIKEPWKPCCI
jgi:hypothetical protein